MDVGPEGPRLIVTPFARHSVRALQPLGAGGTLRLSISGELLGLAFEFRLPALELPGGQGGSSGGGGRRYDPMGRRGRRRTSLGSQASDTSCATSDDVSIGTADDAVAELRARLSEPGDCARSSASGSEDGRAGAVASVATGTTVADVLRQNGEEPDDPCLLRWLAARGHDVDDAEVGLRRHAAWRAEYTPGGRISEDDIRKELAMEKVFLQGCDTLGRPVMIVLAARHDMSARNLEETNRLIVYVLDNAAAAATDKHLNPLGRFLCLFDLSGLRMNNLDVKALRGIFELLQGHFPERLSQLWFLNAPFIFWGIWRIVSPFIEPATRDKIVFLSGSERAARLKEVIPAEVLPRQYGGQGDLVSVSRAAAAVREGAERKKHARHRSSTAVEQQPPSESRLGAARSAIGRWAASGWAGVKHAGAAVARVRVPAPHLPPLPRPHLWWWHAAEEDGAARLARAGGKGQSQLPRVMLMRHHSVRLQRAVVSHVSSSRLALASRRLVPALIPRLKPLNPKVWVAKLWGQVRRIAAAAWAKTPALRHHHVGPAPLPILPASRLDGGLAP